MLVAKAVQPALSWDETLAAWEKALVKYWRRDASDLIEAGAEWLYQARQLRLCAKSAAEGAVAYRAFPPWAHAEKNASLVTWVQLVRQDLAAARTLDDLRALWENAPYHEVRTEIIRRIDQVGGRRIP